MHIIKKNFYKIIKKYRPALISTMGRSGTWYNREFIFFYNQLLNGKKADQIIDEMIKNKTKIKYMVRVNRKILSYDAFFISHWLAPGFIESYKGKLKEKWENLKFYGTEIPSRPTEYMDIYNVDYHCNPYRNKNAKVVYYFRNPLDQAVSYFRTIQTHKVKDLNFYIDEKGNKKPFKDIHDFLRTVGIDMYIKHYLSFKLMKDFFPENFLLIEYEKMISDPVENFKKVLNFFNHNVEKLNFSKEFDEAIKLSSKESITKLENSYGTSISKASTDDRIRQVTDGTIGKWKQNLTDEDLKYVDQRFKEFDMSLSNFILE